MILRTTIILFALIFAPALCHAYLENYPPDFNADPGKPVSFTKGDFETSPILRAGDITIQAEKRGAYPFLTVYRFFHRGKRVYELNRDRKYPYLGEVWRADLDKNGLEDVAI